MGRSWIMDERGDDLAPSFGPFAPEELIRLLDTVAREWREAADVLGKALASCADPRAPRELGVARVAGLCFRSAVNVYRTYLLRRDRPADMRERFREIVADEVAVLEEALPLVEADARLGFHAECQGYMFTAEAIRLKLAGLREL